MDLKKTMAGIMGSVIMVGMGGCAASTEPGTAATTSDSETIQIDLGAGAGNEVEMANKTTIANALGVDNNDERIPSLMNTVKSLNEGLVVSSSYTELSNDRFLDVVFKEGPEKTSNYVRYRIFLNPEKELESVQNIDTGEWVIFSK